MRQRWSRILLSIAAALVLALSLTGVGIQVASSRLEGNITAVDISTTTGREHAPIQIVDDEGNYQAVNILLMGSDSREGETTKKYGDPDLYTASAPTPRSCCTCRRTGRLRRLSASLATRG